MAYDQYDRTVPTITSQHAQAWDEIRNNTNALSHMFTAGVLVGWNGAPNIGAGTAQMPDSYTYTNVANPSILVRLTFTWGTAGVMLDLLEVVLMEYSTDTGGNWDTIGTATMAMTETGAFPSITWS